MKDWTTDGDDGSGICKHSLAIAHARWYWLDVNDSMVRIGKAEAQPERLGNKWLQRRQQT